MRGWITHRRNGNRRRWYVALPVGLVLVGGIAAALVYAEGQGTGSTQTGPIPAPVAQQVTVSVDDIPTPPSIESPVPVGFSITDSSSVPVHISAVAAAVTAITGAVGACDTDWFTVTPSSAYMVGGHATGLPASLSPGDSLVNATDWTLSFSDNGGDQTGCVGAQLTVTVTAS